MTQSQKNEHGFLDKFFYHDQAIREENGLYSVYDIITVLGGQKAPRKVWERIKNDHIHTVQKCHSVRFPRKDSKSDRSLLWSFF